MRISPTKHGGPFDRRFAATLVGLLMLLAVAAAPAHTQGVVSWHTAWARSQAPTSGAPALSDQTVRVVLRVTGGGSDVRVRLQNAFGKSATPDGTPPLTVDAATVGRRSSGAALVAGSTRPLTFAGQRAVTIASGAAVTSDPVPFQTVAGQDLAVSVHTPSAVPPAHPFSAVTNYVSGAGDATADESGDRFTSTTATIPIVAAVDVRGTGIAGTVVTIGGSVVDGVGSTTNGFDAWPDLLAKRFLDEPATQRRTVANAGVAGTAAATACRTAGGPSAEERLDRDVFALAGVSHLIVYAGTNDLAQGCTGDQIIAAFEHIVRDAHAHGVRVVISTVSPRAAYNDAQNAYRSQVNAWVRAGGDCGGGCDSTLDFDAVLRDPTQPNRIDPTLDAGDGIHPNPEGYRRMAASIDMAAFRTPEVLPPAVARPKPRIRLRARKAGTGFRITATVRSPATRRVRVTLRRSGRFLRRGNLNLRAGRGSIAFTVTRGGRYAATVAALDGKAGAATSHTLVLGR